MADIAFSAFLGLDSTEEIAKGTFDLIPHAKYANKNYHEYEEDE